VGWSRWIFGGSFGAGNPVCDSVAVIPGDNGAGQTFDSSDRDEVWVVVKRTINGATVRYVEFIERYFETGQDQEDAVYVDSCITYDSTSATAMTGLGHLEGETIKVFGDGAIQTDVTVASAAATLAEAASTVQMGLGYTHKLKTLRLDADTNQTALGRPKNYSEMVFTLLNSHTISFGPTSDLLQNEDFRLVGTPMDAATPFFTGDWTTGFDGTWSDDARIVIQSDDPVPFTLLAIAAAARIERKKI